VAGLLEDGGGGGGGLALDEDVLDEEWDPEKHEVTSPPPYNLQNILIYF